MRHSIILTGTTALVVLLSCKAQPSPAELCEDTIQSYGVFRDDPDQARPYAELFTPDGSFALGGNVTTGHEALMARHKESHENQRWQHIMSAPVISIQDERIIAVTQVSVKTGPKLGEMDTIIIGQYQDEFQIVSGSCRIKSRKTSVISRDSL